MNKEFREKLYTFKVPKYDPSQLIVFAIEDYVRFTRKKVNLATIHETKMNHILLNFIRHNMFQDYDQKCINNSFEKDPREYLKWFQAINNEIANKYPFLRKVVAAQISDKERQIHGERDDFSRN